MSNVASTETRLLSLTTPFIPPQNRDCAISDLTSISGSYVGYNATSTTYIVFSDPLDAAVPESRFAFSPAVCPSQWNAFLIRKSSFAGKKVTLAFCCARLYDISNMFTKLADGNRQCVSQFDDRYIERNTTIEATLSHGTGTLQNLTRGMLMHPAWTIIWQASEEGH